MTCVFYSTFQKFFKFYFRKDELKENESKLVLNRGKRHIQETFTHIRARRQDARATYALLRKFAGIAKYVK